jgi:hypothetical protein
MSPDEVVSFTLLTFEEGNGLKNILQNACM